MAPVNLDWDLQDINKRRQVRRCPDGVSRVYGASGKVIGAIQESRLILVMSMAVRSQEVTGILDYMDKATENREGREIEHL